MDEFEQWWEKVGSPYEQAVIENGGKPWTDDIEERRALWERRYQQPAPPAMPSTNLDRIRRKN